MLANVLLAGEVCQTLSGPADGNICSVFLILVSVQREPSGHNLKHPTKWCPPNK